jgi:hypothetical protein
VADFDEWLKATDQVVERLEASALLNREEMEGVREKLAADLRAEGKAGADRLRTIRIGRARVLVPGRDALREANLTSQRVRERFSTFKLTYLSKEDIRAAFERGDMQQVGKDNFVRYSNRLADNVRTFLRQIGELEPSLKEEVDETLRQVDDAENDLLKLEIRSFTSVRENLLRAANGRMTRVHAGRAINTFDLNRNLFNLSMLAHPEAVARSLMANASDRMAERATRSVADRPKKAFVVVTAGPNAVSRMRPNSRTASLLWRVWSQADLDRHYQAVNTKRTATTTWRGLGYDYNTPEWYVPVPPEHVEEATQAMRERRRGLLDMLADRADAEEGED